VQLGLVQNPPAAGPAAALVEGAIEFAAQTGTGPQVPGRGARVGHQAAVDDLGDQMLGDLQKVLVGGVSEGGVGHWVVLGGAGLATILVVRRWAFAGLAPGVAGVCRYRVAR
jgi:hypothetical protein